KVLEQPSLPCVAGLVGMTCLFLIDLAKCVRRCQAGRAGVVTSGMAFTSQLGFSLPGAAVNLTLVTLEKAIKLTTNDFLCHMLMEYGYGGNLKTEMLAACGAGVCQVVVMCPMEMFKIQLRASAEFGLQARLLQVLHHGLGVQPKCLSATLIAWKLLHTQDLAGLHKDLGTTLLRDVPFSIIYFPLFANLNSLRFSELAGKVSFAHSFMSGCVAGSIVAVAVTPLDGEYVAEAGIRHLGSKAEDIRPIFTPRKFWIQKGPSAFLKGIGCWMPVIALFFWIAQGVYLMGIGERILKCFE
uniref:Solute carrier family 25 member 18 n=1 Tax=Oryctolagus cuniculus TaxID=9986 RepID=A0A5F9C890_RABIT